MEGPLARRVLAGMTSWLSRVRDVVLAAWNRWRGRPDPSAVYQTQPLWDRVVNALVPDMMKAARLGWTETTARPYTGQEQFVFDQMAKVRNLLTHIPDETATMISDEISKAVSMGASPEQIAAGVQRILDVTGSNYWPNRAKVIAVTSVHSMANAGSQAAMLMLQARSDRQLLKEWVSREDERVRPTHHVADGQRVPVASYFMVGSSPLLFPGDPDAPAGEVVNCRCSMKLVEA
jgi:uncharacterized protein with gpF-like domain